MLEVDFLVANCDAVGGGSSLLLRSNRGLGRGLACGGSWEVSFSGSGTSSRVLRGGGKGARAGAIYKQKQLYSK